MQGNPLLESEQFAREMIIGRAENLTELNGALYKDAERRDCEMYYLKRVKSSFMELKGVTSLVADDPEFGAYAFAEHPRYFDLCAKYGEGFNEEALK